MDKEEFKENCLCKGETGDIYEELKYITYLTCTSTFYWLQWNREDGTERRVFFNTLQTAVLKKGKVPDVIKKTKYTHNTLDSNESNRKWDFEKHYCKCI